MVVSPSDTSSSLTSGGNTLKPTPFRFNVSASNEVVDRVDHGRVGGLTSGLELCALN